MFWLAIISIVLSIISTLFLLASPYLRITSLGWFIGIWWIPILGALFFLLTVIRNQARGEDRHFDKLKAAHEHKPECQNHLMNCIARDHGFLPYFYLHDYELYRDDAFIPELINCIDNATTRVWITTYIFSGQVSEELLRSLTKAHERGVQVCLLIDRVGSGILTPSKAIQQKLAVYPFNFSIFRQSLLKSILFVEKRLHSKIVIIDEDMAFIGAHNLRDEVLSPNKNFARNTTLKFHGPVVQQLEAVFADLWLKNTEQELPVTQVSDGDIFPLVSSQPSPPQPSPLPSQTSSHLDLDDHSHEDQPQKTASGIPARIIFSDPVSRTHAYDQYLTTLLMAAKQRIYIWMPYMIPTQTMRDTLMAKCKLGLDIKVLVPGKSDSVLVDNTHQLVIRELNDCGVACAQSKGAFDHSKVLIIDDVVILGSTNLDYRSLYRNYEANIEVNDQEFCERIVREFDVEFANSVSVEKMKTGLMKTMLNQFTSLIAALY
ncbi:putative cardiolipin synthase YwiE [Thalassocella blandensis]|nr:putative cardiolipin synthase YwiE [Thalassocella blandensis]